MVEGVHRHSVYRIAPHARHTEKGLTSQLAPILGIPSKVLHLGGMGGVLTIPSHSCEKMGREWAWDSQTHPCGREEERRKKERRYKEKRERKKEK